MSEIIKAVSSGQISLSSRDQMLIFAGLLAAFAVKAPVFPLHTWLPNTYAEAPDAGDIFVSGDHVEDGYLRAAALRYRAGSLGSASLCAMDCRMRHHWHRLWRAVGVGSNQYQTPARVFLV